MAKVTMKERKEKLAELLEANLGAELTEELATEIKGVFGSQHQSTKTNENGEVFCNYFQTYLPAEEFAVSKKGKLDSMSKEGKRLFRTQKSMVSKATAEVLKQFRAKEISAAEMEELLATIDENAKYRYPQGTESVPANYPFEV
jgi:tryptophanyl-tRNA synthetase